MLLIYFHPAELLLRHILLLKLFSNELYTLQNLLSVIQSSRCLESIFGNHRSYIQVLLLFIFLCSTQLNWSMAFIATVAPRITVEN